MQRGWIAVGRGTHRFDCASAVAVAPPSTTGALALEAALPQATAVAVGSLRLWIGYGPGDDSDRFVSHYAFELALDTEPALDRAEVDLLPVRRVRLDRAALAV